MQLTQSVRNPRSAIAAATPRVLVLAGLDSGGGAGITADLITLHDHGAFGLPCPTALTAQSLSAVAGVEPVRGEFFKLTCDTVLKDFADIAAVKVGLVTSDEVLRLILKLLREALPGVPVVWDPVLNATAGRLKSADLKANLNAILQSSEIFTPNLPEALELLGLEYADYERLGGIKIGEMFLERGAHCVIIKGGHLPGEAEAADAFVSATTKFYMSYPRIRGDGAHGSGCALSSALAGLLAAGYAAHDAAVLAKAYVTRGILEPAFASAGDRPPLGHHGMICDLRYMPHIREPGFPEAAGPFPPCPQDMGLYPVLPDVHTLERFLSMGVRTAQLRIKDPSAPGLRQDIARAVTLGNELRARVFIDDHYATAIAAHAYGVHLGMEDLQTADLEAIRAAHLRLGVSTHGIYELLKALQLRPSYIALGHLFPTTTKKMPSRPQGLVKFAHQIRLLNGTVPTVAIGGIKRDQVAAIRATGVGAVAVVTALTKAADPLLEVQDWLRRVGNGGDRS